MDRDGTFLISAKNTPRYSLSTLKLGVRGQGAEANKSRTHSLAALPLLRMVLYLYRHGTLSHPNFPILRAQTVRGRIQSVVRLPLCVWKNKFLLQTPPFIFLARICALLCHGATPANRHGVTQLIPQGNAILPSRPQAMAASSLGAHAHAHAGRTTG